MLLVVVVPPPSWGGGAEWRAADEGAEAATVYKTLALETLTNLTRSLTV